MSGARVHELDLLRFVAALAVVFFHYAFRGFAADDLSVMPYPLLAPAARYGYLGVELFFMISGFVILMTASSGSFRGFLISRAVRLYPAFWVCCTLTFLVTLAIGAPRFSASLGRFLVNMTMMSGFVGVPSIDGVYWSLFVELRFYALIAIVLAIGRMDRIEPILLAWLALSIALRVVRIEPLRVLVIVDYSAYFIAGAACYLAWSQGWSRTRAGMVLCAWVLAVVQSVRSLRGFDETYATTMNPVVVAGVITSFFVVMALIASRRFAFAPHPSWVLLGALTYPLYLLHQNIGYMVFNSAYPQVDAHVLFWGTLGGALVAALAVHRFVERPLGASMKVFLNRLGRPRPAVAEPLRSE